MAIQDKEEDQKELEDSKNTSKLRETTYKGLGVICVPDHVLWD